MIKNTFYYVISNENEEWLTPLMNFEPFFNRAKRFENLEAVESAKARLPPFDIKIYSVSATFNLIEV